MKITTFIALSFFSMSVIGQTFSEADIKTLADQVNQEFKGVDIGNGITSRGCIAIGRTLIYQYDVPDYWEAPSDIRKDLISNLKTSGAAKSYFLNDIDVDFYYYKGHSLIKKISIKSNEFSTYKFELGEYLSIKDHIKSKDVNLKLKVPQGWEVKEGNRPNIVTKFSKDGNTYAILIKENMTFFSRGENRELLSDESFVDEFVDESSSFLKDPKVIDKSVVTIDTYPTVTFKVRGIMESSGIPIPVIMRSWVVYYEDKIVFLQAMGVDKAEFNALEKLFFLITNSVIFPDQYN